MNRMSFLLKLMRLGAAGNCLLLFTRRTGGNRIDTLASIHL